MEFDLNIEAVVEGDDQLLLEHNQGGALEEQVVVIDLNAPPSLDMDSSDHSGDATELMGPGEEVTENVELVLALQAPTINFGVDKIQPHELLSTDEDSDNTSVRAGNDL
jgi:hypothetical protein